MRRYLQRVAMPAVWCGRRRSLAFGWYSPASSQSALTRTACECWGGRASGGGAGGGFSLCQEFCSLATDGSRVSPPDSDPYHRLWPPGALTNPPPCPHRPTGTVITPAPLTCTCRSLRSEGLPGSGSRVGLERRIGTLLRAITARSRASQERCAHIGL